MLARGDTFFTPEKPPHSRRHLYVVVSDPTLNADKIVIVNFTTFRAGKRHDPTCIVEARSHKHLPDPSYVYYAGAAALSTVQYEEAIRRQSFTPSVPVSAEILERVTAGFQASDEAPLGCVRILRDQGFFAPSDEEPDDFTE